MNTNHFPLNFDTLSKGDTIPIEKVEAFAGCSRGTDRFHLAMLALRDLIVRECRERGKHFTVAIVRGQLRVLTDEEAAEYNARTFRHGFRRSVRSLGRLLKVDVANLTAEQRQVHERNVLVCGKMIQAARAARAKVLLFPHARQVPGLPQPKEQDHK